MKKMILSISAVIALSGFAMGGGDITPVIPTDSWSGFYVGTQLGGSWGDADMSDQFVVGPPQKYFSHPNPNGFLGGLYLGYNWRFDNGWLVGLEGSYNWSDAKDQAVDTDEQGNVQSDMIFEIQQKWEAAILARVGKIIDESYMPYLLGGATWTRLHAIGHYWGDDYADNDTVSGWTVGVGIEFKLTENLHARMQYRYNNYRDAEFDISGLPTSVDYNAHMLQVGFSYRF